MGLYAHRVQYDDSEYQYVLLAQTHPPAGNVRRGQPPRRPRATIVQVDSGCDRRSDVHVLPPPATAFLGARLTRALRARETADDRPRPARIVPPWHNMPSSGTLVRCRSAMSGRRRRLSPPDGRRRASSTQRPMRQCGVPAPYRTEIVVDESTTDYQAAHLYLRLGHCTSTGEIDKLIRMSNRTYGAWDRPPPPVPPPRPHGIACQPTRLLQ